MPTVISCGQHLQLAYSNHSLTGTNRIASQRCLKQSHFSGQTEPTVFGDNPPLFPFHIASSLLPSLFSYHPLSPLRQEVDTSYEARGAR